MSNTDRFDATITAIVRGLKEYGPKNVGVIDVVAAAGYVVSNALDMLPEKERRTVLDGFVRGLRLCADNADTESTSFGFGTRH